MTTESASLEITVLGSGSKGNATLIRHGDWAVLVDAGFSGKELKRRLETVGTAPADVQAVLVTHEHSDHVKGLLPFCRQADCGIWANGMTALQLRDKGKAPESVTVFANGAPFELGPLTIEAFSISHDAVDPVGFVVTAGTARAALVTDLGFIGKMVPVKVRNSDLLVVESNHCPTMLRSSQRPARLQQRIHGRRGHLSNEDAATLIKQTVGPDTRHVILAHLSEDCNCPDLARNHAEQALRDLDRMDVSLQVASQGGICETVVL